MVSRVGLEPTTPSLRGSCSNQLSYRPKYGLCLTIVMQMYLWRLGSYSENDFTRQHVPQTELSYRPKYGLCLTLLLYHKKASFTIWTCSALSILTGLVVSLFFFLLFPAEELAEVGSVAGFLTNIYSVA